MGEIYFLHYLAREIKSKTNATYAQALEVAKQFQKEDGFRDAYKKWQKVTKKSNKKGKRGPTHIKDLFWDRQKGKHKPLTALSFYKWVYGGITNYNGTSIALLAIKELKMVYRPVPRQIHNTNADENKVFMSVDGVHFEVVGRNAPSNHKNYQIAGGTLPLKLFKMVFNKKIGENYGI